MPRIATVINYCTNDYRFIKQCIDAVRPFSKQIIVPVSDHFFDGTLENRELLQKTFDENPGVTFIEYEWDSLSGGKDLGPRYWHNMSRIIGVNQTADDIEQVLFLDSDEIMDSTLFTKFVTENRLSYDSYKIAAYWYFREPIYRATRLTGPAVLIKRRKIRINPFSPWEREQMFDLLEGATKLEDATYKGEVMLHHYSWVRTKEQMLKKVQSWGHKGEKNWVELVEEEFSRPFNGKDFVHGFEYKVVENKFDL